MTTAKTKRSSVGETNSTTSNISFLRKDKVWLDIPINEKTFPQFVIKKTLHKLLKRRHNRKLQPNSMSLGVDKEGFLIRLNDADGIAYSIYLHHAGTVSVASYDNETLSELVVDVSKEYVVFASSIYHSLYGIAAREYFVNANHLT